MSRKIIPNDPRHRLWCAMRLGLGAQAFQDCCGTVGLEDENGGIMAVVVFNQYVKHSTTGLATCHGSIAALPGTNWASRRYIKAFLAYAFEGLAVSCLICQAAKGNRRSRDFIEALGFRRAGKIRRGLDGRQDAMLYDMLPKNAAKWLGYEPTAWKDEKAAANG